jgi:hypothetical protein
VRKVFIILLLLTSCYVDDVSMSNDGGGYIIDPIPGDDYTPPESYTFSGQIWVITNYRVGIMGTPIPISDTLQFLTTSTYTYNNIQSTYTLYPTGSEYNLTLNNTPWGNLSGRINDNNITYGVILGRKFINISVGSNDTTEYYLWLNKL